MQAMQINMASYVMLNMRGLTSSFQNITQKKKKKRKIVKIHSGIR